MKGLLWTVGLAFALAIGAMVWAVAADSNATTPPPAVTFEAVVERVIDGDTIEVAIQPAPSIFLRWRIRLLGANAPELHASRSCEREAGAEARRMLGTLIETRPTVWLLEVRPDKYHGRYDARVMVGDVDAAAWMIDRGLARPYGGEARQPWCED